MKKLITIISFTLLAAVGFAQNWQNLSCPSPGGQLGDIDRNSNTIYATRLTGGFFKSTDGGVTWSDVTANYPAGQTQIFRCLTSGKILLHIFTGSTFPWYYSTDQGTTWTEITGSNPTNSSLYESSNGTLYSIPSFNGFATIKTSTDEGATWVSQSEVLKSIAFTSNGDAYALRWRSGNGDVKLAKSTDNGVTWVDLTATGMPYDAQQIVISPNGKIYLTGGSTGGTLMSADNGSTFTSIGTSVDEMFTDYNNNLFTKKAPSTFMVTTDDGTTWQDAKTGLDYPSGTVRSIWGHPNGNTYASNYNPGTSTWGIYKYSSGLGSSINETEVSSGIQVYPNPGTTAINFSIDVNDIGGDITIYNQLGELVLTQRITSSIMNVSLVNFSQGVYYVRIKSKSGQQNIKFVKQ